MCSFSFVLFWFLLTLLPHFWNRTVWIGEKRLHFIQFCLTFCTIFYYFLSKTYSSIVYTDQNSTTLRSELYILENSKSSSVHLVELLPLNISCYIIHFSKLYRTTSTQPLFLPVTKIELYGLEKWISILYSSFPAPSIIPAV